MINFDSMPPANRAWLAGFMDGYGSFAKYGHNGIGYKARTTRVITSMRHFSKITQLPLVEYVDAKGQPGVMITVTNEELHNLMRGVWKDLRGDRRIEYGRLRKAQQAAAAPK